MVEAKALIYRIDRKLDRLNTKGSLAVGVVDKCNALTEAQYFLIKDRIQRIEQDKRARYELRQLEVKNHPVEVSESGKISKFKMPEDLYRDLGIIIVATKRGCGRKEIALTKLETQDIGKSLNNPFWQTSFAWEQIFGDEAQDILYVYNGVDCKVETMIIDYIKKAPEIHCPSLIKGPDQYIDWNGKPQTKDQGWVLDDLQSEGIDLAVKLLTRDIGDPNDFQLQTSNISTTDQSSKL